ncbi:MAG: 4Fe-4S ferredoxin, partial [Lentisphaerae bacterium]|nr:4Fe-4S ferredoxin [Lentisphaerota bacterium]
MRISCPEALESTKVSRKDFLKLGATAGAAVAGGVVLSAYAAQPAASAPPEAAPKRSRRWGMVIDLQRCILCRSCTVACKQENKTPPGMLYNPVLEEETGEYPKPARQWFPRPCQHCEKPACLEACPNAAIIKRADGIVYIDPQLCQGVQACIDACPYGVPVFDKGDKYVGDWNEIASPELTLMAKPGKG